MSYSYKLLDSKDINIFKKLLIVFGEAFEEPKTYQANIPSDEYLQSLFAKDHFIVIVALFKDEVVGGLVAYVLDKFEQERKEIYIYDLAVGKDHRRKGLATGLIQNLRKVTRERGAYVIFVQADPGDTPAIKLYESLGTREDVHHFDIKISKD